MKIAIRVGIDPEPQAILHFVRVERPVAFAALVGHGDADLRRDLKLHGLLRRVAGLVDGRGGQRIRPAGNVVDGIVALAVRLDGHVSTAQHQTIDRCAVVLQLRVIGDFHAHVVARQEVVGLVVILVQERHHRGCRRDHVHLENVRFRRLNRI